MQPVSHLTPSVPNPLPTLQSLPLDLLPTLTPPVKSRGRQLAVSLAWLARTHSFSQESLNITEWLMDLFENLLRKGDCLLSSLYMA